MNKCKKDQSSGGPDSSSGLNTIDINAQEILWEALNSYETIWSGMSRCP